MNDAIVCDDVGLGDGGIVDHNFAIGGLDHEGPALHGLHSIYRSGVAARLAGVRVDTLRVWERRYAVVGPRLSAGRQRLYSPGDIKRLTLIKQLVDMGHPIGTIAALSDDELARMRAGGGVPDESATKDVGDVRIALVGSLVMVEQVGRALSGSVGRIVASSPDPDKALSNASVRDTLSSW